MRANSAVADEALKPDRLWPDRDETWEVGELFRFELKTGDTHNNSNAHLLRRALAKWFEGRCDVSVTEERYVTVTAERDEIVHIESLVEMAANFAKAFYEMRLFILDGHVLLDHLIVQDLKLDKALISLYGENIQAAVWDLDHNIRNMYMRLRYAVNSVRQVSP